MKEMLSIGGLVLATVAVSAWVLRREIHRAPAGPRDPWVAAALRREEQRQRPWEGRN